MVQVATALAARLGIAIEAGCVTRTKTIPELKNVYDYDSRVRLLATAHAVQANIVDGKKILVFDDLYRSGATMNAVTEALYEQGRASEVYALTLTRTRSKS